jgi:hypothetical protein
VVLVAAANELTRQAAETRRHPSNNNNIITNILSSTINSKGKLNKENSNPLRRDRPTL